MFEMSTGTLSRTVIKLITKSTDFIIVLFSLER